MSNRETFFSPTAARVYLVFLLLCTQSRADDEASLACQRLLSEDFSTVLDAPTQLILASVVDEHDTIPRYCAIGGYVAPSVGFLLALPLDRWNQKFLQEGCGGFCGRSNNGTRFFDQQGLETGFSGALSRGYALLITDAGQSGDISRGLWAYHNLAAQFDFGVRALHVAALAGKAVAERYYRRAPSKSYFWGCSTGGQQALAEAQRFPWDFDGIIAGAPSPTFSGPMMYYLWAARALVGVVNQEDLKLVHEHALARCDKNDGLKDGIIGDPLHCQFDPTELLCKEGETAHCLTAAQVEAVKKVYSGPTTSTGVKLYTGGPLPGSELNWIKEGGYVEASGAASTWPKEYFSYIGFMPAPGPSWKPEDFDFDRDYKRLRMAESLFGAADNPDLRKFKAADGKLLMYQGGADESDITMDAVDYYETAQKTLGSRQATEDFFRLFVIPGMNHCGGGAGAYSIDYLSYLEAWTEKGQPPDKLLSAHVKYEDIWDRVVSGEPDAQQEFRRRLTFPLDPKTVSFSRPVYPYPTLAKYKGRGDPNEAESFVPARPGN